MAVIATDAGYKGFTNSATSLTYAHTCTGSNLYLLVCFWVDGGNTATGVTYNGVAMTQLKTTTASNSRTPYMFGLANPAEGSNNIVISVSGTTLIYAVSQSYTGVKSTQPDSSSSGNVTAATGITGTTTVVASNCWTVMYVNSGTVDALGTGSAGSGTTLRIQGDSNGTLYDSNGTVSTGSQSLIANLTSGSDDMGQLIISLAPSVATGNFFMVL